MTINRPQIYTKPLAVITKPSAGPFAALLAQHGLEILRFPTIEIEFLISSEQLWQEATTLGLDDWLVFTSQNAVAAVFEDRAGQYVTGRNAAVGESTAKALQKYGRSASFVPQTANAVALATELAQHHPLAGKRVILFVAEQARPELAAYLRQFGALVTVIPAYRTIIKSQRNNGYNATAELQGFLAAINGRSVIYTFASPSALTGFVDLLGEQAITLLKAGQVITIGPTTSQHAAVLGVRVDQLAKKTSLEGMVEAVLACWQDQSGPVAP
jgi:uroporphyrinogen-III synthase